MALLHPLLRAWVHISTTQRYHAVPSLIPAASPRYLPACLQDRLAASAGAACHGAGAGSISSVLAAMGVPPQFAVGTLRLSVGRHSTEEEVDAAVGLIVEAARKQGVL